MYLVTLHTWLCFGSFTVVNRIFNVNLRFVPQDLNAECYSLDFIRDVLKRPPYRGEMWLNLIHFESTSSFLTDLLSQQTTRDVSSESCFWTSQPFSVLVHFVNVSCHVVLHHLECVNCIVLRSHLSCDHLHFLLEDQNSASLRKRLVVSDWRLCLRLFDFSLLADTSSQTASRQQTVIRKRPQKPASY